MTSFELFRLLKSLKKSMFYIFFILFLLIYSKIPLLRPPFGLLKSGLISEVVLILNTIS